MRRKLSTLLHPLQAQKCELAGRSLKIRLSTTGKRASANVLSSAAAASWSRVSQKRAKNPVVLGEATRNLRIVNFESSEANQFTDALVQVEDESAGSAGGSNVVRKSSNGSDPRSPAATDETTSADAVHVEDLEAGRLHVSLCYNDTLDRLIVAVYEVAAVSSVRGEYAPLDDNCKASFRCSSAPRPPSNVASR